MNYYHLSTSTMKFRCRGGLESVDGTLLLRLRVTTDQAFAVQADIKAELPVGILAIADGEALLGVQTLKVKVRPDGEKRFELAVLLLA